MGEEQDKAPDTGEVAIDQALASADAELAELAAPVTVAELDPAPLEAAADELEETADAIEAGALPPEAAAPALATAEAVLSEVVDKAVTAAALDEVAPDPQNNPAVDQLVEDTRIHDPEHAHTLALAENAKRPSQQPPPEAADAAPATANDSSWVAIDQGEAVPTSAPVEATDPPLINELVPVEAVEAAASAEALSLGADASQPPANADPPGVIWLAGHAEIGAGSGMGQRMLEGAAAASSRKQPEFYICHKRVQAFKIGRIEGRIEGDRPYSILWPADEEIDGFIVDDAWMQKHAPQVGGYLVRYADGYKSYSPAAAFENGYTLESEMPPSSSIANDEPPADPNDPVYLITEMRVGIAHTVLHIDQAQHADYSAKLAQAKILLMEVKKLLDEHVVEHNEQVAKVAEILRNATSVTLSPIGDGS